MIKTKKTITIIAFIIITFSFLYSEEKTFNYYKRSFLGEYELKNIDYGDLLEGIKPPKYVATYDDDSKITKVVGYYIGGEKIKFGDIIENGKVSVTIYFDYDTKKVIYFKKYIREGGKLKRIELKAIKTVISNKIDYVEEYSYLKDKIAVNNSIIVKKIKEKNLQIRFVGKGYYDLKYNPLSFTWLFYKTDKEGKELGPVKIEEKCEYNERGQITKSISIFPETNEELALFLFHYDADGKLIKEEEWNYNKYYYYLTIHKENKIIDYVKKADDTKLQNTGIYRIIGLKDLFDGIEWIPLDPWAKTQPNELLREIYFNDESYLFEFRDNKLYDITAKLRLRYLPNKYFILPPYGYADIYDMFIDDRIKELYER